MYVYRFIDVGREECACDVEPVQVEIVLGGEGQKKVNGFSVSGGSKAVAEGVSPFFVTEGDQASLVFGGDASGVHFDFEVDLGW